MLKGFNLFFTIEILSKGEIKVLLVKEKASKMGKWSDFWGSQSLEVKKKIIIVTSFYYLVPRSQKSKM
jgi:hypothetical protein